MCGCLEGAAACRGRRCSARPAQVGPTPGTQAARCAAGGDTGLLLRFASGVWPAALALAAGGKPGHQVSEAPRPPAGLPLGLRGGHPSRLSLALTLEMDLTSLRLLRSHPSHPTPIPLGRPYTYTMFWRQANARYRGFAFVLLALVARVRRRCAVDGCSWPGAAGLA